MLHCSSQQLRPSQVGPARPEPVASAGVGSEKPAGGTKGGWRKARGYRPGHKRRGGRAGAGGMAAADGKGAAVDVEPRRGSQRSAPRRGTAGSYSAAFSW